MTLASSIAYYNANAQKYFDTSMGIDMAPVQNAFLRRLPKGSLILDAGCGGGRDSLAFLQKGYLVHAFDASEALVEKARALTGLPVDVLTFAALDAKEVFDGIWACSSLVHLDRAEMDQALRNFYAALLPDGVAYLSLKEGDGQIEGTDGRTFNAYSLTEAKGLFERAGFEVKRAWKSPIGNTTNQWLNFVVTKPGPNPVHFEPLPAEHTFFAKCIRGEESLDAEDLYEEAWHCNPRTDIDLPEYLGLAPAEYQEFLVNPASLKALLADKQ